MFLKNIFSGNLQQKIGILLVIGLYVVLFFQYFFIEISDDFPYLAVAQFLQFPVEDNYIGPFYPLFLKSNLLLFGNPISAYKISILACNLLIFFLLIRMVYQQKRGINAWVFLIFCFLCLNPQLIQLIPKISVFCMGLVSFGIYFVRNQTIEKKYLVLLLVSFILAYSRPEFYISFLIIGVFGGWTLRKKRTLLFVHLISFLFLFGFGMFFLAGSPMGSRALDAFQQHFILNYLHWHPEIKLPNQDGAEFVLFDQVYGHVDSAYQLFFENPGLFIQHVSSNFINVFKGIYLIIKSGVNYIFVWYTSVYLLILAVIFCTFTAFQKSLQNVRNFYKEWVKEYLFSYLLLCFPTIFSIFLIYPREHYLLFHIVFILFSGMLFLNQLEFRTAKSKEWLFTLSLLALIVFQFIWKKDMYFRKANLPLEAVFAKMQLLGQDGEKSFYSNERFDIAFFKNYYKNKHNINNQISYVVHQKPDVLYFRLTNPEEVQKVVAKSELKEYRPDYQFSKYNILIFTKK